MAAARLAPVYPDRLRLEVENPPDLVGRRDWVEAIRLAEEMAASGNGISGLHTPVHHSLTFKGSTQFVGVGCYSWKMEKETNVFNFGTIL
jgi:hypothetical protein